jgi:hypothetical protein
MAQKIFENSFREYSKTLAKESNEISGILGVYLNGEQLVDVPNRPGFVYVRLRDNLSEVVQVFNENVSVIYDLAVIVVREGNRYYIKGRDTLRYNNWNSPSSFVPAHANQHAFNPSEGGGGDILWVQGRQIVPLGAYPSGTKGSPNVSIYPYQFREDDGVLVTYGATGTGDIAQYKPVDNTAIMGIVYIDTNTGNPEFILNSGSFFPASITGTQEVVQYLPAVSDSTFLIAAGIRLVSGTSSIGWDNIYDLRQWHSTSAISPTIIIEDEGIQQGTASTLNFVGDIVDVSVVGNEARIFITGSAGGGGSGDIYTLRKLLADLTIPDTGNLIVTNYFDLDTHILTLEGDSVLEVIE